MKTVGLILAIILVLSATNYGQNDLSFDKVFCYRQVERQGNAMVVTLLINTVGLERDKTLKIKEKFPTGFQCKVIEPYGSTNAVTETSVLFVWSALPVNDLFYVKYQLSSASALNESVNIIGNVSFLSETGIKYVSVVEQNFLDNQQVVAKIKNLPPYTPGATVTKPATSNISVADVPKTQETKPVEVQQTPTSKPIPRTNVKDEPKNIAQVTPTIKEEPKHATEAVERVVLTEEQPEATPQPIKTESKIKPVENKPAETKPIENKPIVSPASIPEGFYYTVQIGASPKKLPAGYYSKYNFKYDVNEMFIDNMYKYSVGRFSTLKEANNYQNEVRQKGLQSFVVAYNNGKKITIKEALEISKQ